MQDYLQLEIQQITGALPANRTGERYTDYKLSSVLERLGYASPLIFIRSAVRKYQFNDSKVKYLVADVYLHITEEQKTRFHTDKDRLYCAIPARYSGSDEDWVLANYSYVDDIAVRFGLNPRGRLYTVTFTHYIIGGKDHKLQGDRLDWDTLGYFESSYLRNKE